MCATLFLAGCSLDEKLYTDPTPKDIKTQDDIDLMAKGIYSELNDAAAFKMSGPLMIMLTADDLYGDDNANADWKAYGQKEIDAASTGAFWDVMYRSIRNANYLLQFVSSPDVKYTFPDDATKEAFVNQVVGEAYFVRAFCYYYLVRLYGRVPLRLEATDVNSNFFLPRSDVEDVYAQIFRDLTVANACLPVATAIPATDLGRASKGAAQAIMASARLTFGNWLENNGKTGCEEQYSQCVQWCDSVLRQADAGTYALLDNWADLWDVNKETGAYKEVLFGIRFSRDPIKSALASSGSEFCFRFLPNNMYGVTGNTGSTPAGNGDGSIRFHPYFYNDYISNATYSNGRYTTYNDETTGDKLQLDYRLDRGFFTRWKNDNNGKMINCVPRVVVDAWARTDMTNNTGVPQTCTFSAKYVDGAGKDQRNNENDLFIIRLAEIYLLKAEALNELNGPTQAAVDAFNAVRQRAQKADGTARLYPKLLTLADVATRRPSECRYSTSAGWSLPAKADGGSTWCV